jgi:uncharacterized tellurite resistance protein B-like protein
MKDRITQLADILMGAAHADDRLEGDEKVAVKRLLTNVLGDKALPMDLEFRIDEFDPKGFDLAKTAAAFVGDDAETKRKLLELVGAVHGADQEFDLAEDDFLHRLAAVLGVPEDQYRDLVTSVVEEIDVEDAINRVRYGA